MTLKQTEVRIETVKPTSYLCCAVLCLRAARTTNCELTKTAALAPCKWPICNPRIYLLSFAKRGQRRILVSTIYPSIVQPAHPSLLYLVVCTYVRSRGFYYLPIRHDKLRKLMIRKHDRVVRIDYGGEKTQLTLFIFIVVFVSVFVPGNLGQDVNLVRTYRYFASVDT